MAGPLLAAGGGGGPAAGGGGGAAAGAGAPLAPAAAAALQAPARKKPGRQKRTSILCQVRPGWWVQHRGSRTPVSRRRGGAGAYCRNARVPPARRFHAGGGLRRRAGQRKGVSGAGSGASSGLEMVAERTRWPALLLLHYSLPLDAWISPVTWPCRPPLCPRSYYKCAGRGQ